MTNDHFTEGLLALLIVLCGCAATLGMVYHNPDLAQFGKASAGFLAPALLIALKVTGGGGSAPPPSNPLVISPAQPA